jgi:FMN phosphatase YigB (HAD superfamily)
MTEQGSPKTQPQLCRRIPLARTAFSVPRALFFDLNLVLVRYYYKREYPALLGRALQMTSHVLQDAGLLRVPVETISERAALENRENPDLRVRPLEDRLGEVFDILPEEMQGEVRQRCLEAFTRIFLAAGQVYEDVPEGLRQLKLSGFRLAILANAVWGSPAQLWRGDVESRFGDAFEASVFSSDVGLSVPHPAAFAAVYAALDLDEQTCTYVTSSPEFASDKVGMPAIVMRRDGGEQEFRSMDDLVGYLTGR